MTAPGPMAATAPTTPAPRFGLLRPLASRDFRLVWAGQAVSLLGDQFHLVALAWLVLDLTGSGLALGAVLMAASIPRAVLIIVGGALADRFAPRRLMLASDIARSATVGILAVLILTGRVELWQLVVMGVVFGIVDALFFPAMNAIVPSLVPPDRLPAANALVQGTIQLTTSSVRSSRGCSSSRSGPARPSPSTRARSPSPPWPSPRSGPAGAWPPARRRHQLSARPRRRCGPRSWPARATRPPTRRSAPCSS